MASNLDLGLLEPPGNYNLVVKWLFWLQIWSWAFWNLLAITIWLWNCHFGFKSWPGPFGAFWQLQFGCEMAILASNLDLGLLESSGNYNLAVKWLFWLQTWTWAFWNLTGVRLAWQLQFGCEMAILAPNLELGLLEPSGNYNLAVKLPFWLQILTWAFWSLLAITIWLWNGHFGFKPGPGPFGVFWQLQFGCEMAILAANLDLGLLEPSGNYNLAVKWQFWLQIWTWAFWSLLAITIWLWNRHFHSKSGPGPLGAFWQLQFGREKAIWAPSVDLGLFEVSWQLQFGREMAILAPNVDLGLLELSGNYNLAMKWQFWL